MSILNKTTYYTTDELLEVAKKDDIQLETKLIERIKNDEEKAFCIIGERYYHSKDYLKAMVWLLKSAYFQNGASQYFIGRIFEAGTDSIGNKRQALEWYQRSADQGYRLAKTRIIKLRWKGYCLDSNQKTFINLEKKSEELKRSYLDKVEALEQRYQASLKLLYYEKLSLELEERPSIASNTNRDDNNFESSNRNIEELENQIRVQMETLEQKTQVLADEVKALERENVLNQEAFEKEKKAVTDLVASITTEVTKRWQQEKLELNKIVATLNEENKKATNDLIETTKKMENRLDLLEFEVSAKYKLEERIKLLESKFSRSVFVQGESIVDHTPHLEPSSGNSNNQDINKIRVMVEYRVTPQT